MMQNITQTMYSHDSNWEGDYTEEEFILTLGNDETVRVTAGYLGPFYFNNEEIYYITSINQVLIIVASFAMLFALFLGILISKGITRPIQTVIHQLSSIQTDDPLLSEERLFHTNELQELYDSASALEKRIHHQEQLRKQLTQDMAHELKTPLTSIQGQLEAMIDGIFPLTIERIQSTYEEIIRIKSLIKEIENLSSLENKSISLQFDEFNFEILLQEISELFEASLKTEGMKFIIEKSPLFNKNLYDHFHGDHDKIKQIFINMISNSLKYAGKGSTITILLDHTASGDYLLHVKDNGQGILEKDIPFIFERFYRADPSRTGHKGIGIGLTLVKSIVLLHQGSITYQPNHPTGTDFVIIIPYSPAFNKI
ncbi:MAG: HAMP domain-containing histidine kinase, partial [Vallitaleaceae bacterium]|nr:HAMP domain-containing histidine kinase [Vallitaleaceae bacterium]